jgi:hypothetical protein
LNSKRTSSDHASRRRSRSDSGQAERLGRQTDGGFGCNKQPLIGHAEPEKPAALLRTVDSPYRSEPGLPSAPIESPIRTSCWRFSSTDLLRGDATSCPTRLASSRMRSSSLGGAR